MTSGVLRSVRVNRSQKDDTIYCNERFKQKLGRAMKGGDQPTLGGTTTSLRVEGLDVITHPSFTHPIVCRKGEIFPLTEDYKQ